MSAQNVTLAQENDPGLRVVNFIEKFDNTLDAEGYSHADRMKIVGILWDTAKSPAAPTAIKGAARHKFTSDELYFMLTVYKKPGIVLQIPANNQWVQPEAHGMVECTGPFAWRPTDKLDEWVIHAFGFSPVMQGVQQ